MASIVFMIVGFIVLAFLVGFVVYQIVQRKRHPDGKSREMNYKTFFIMGACFLPVGIAVSLSSGEFFYNALSVLGFIYLIIGLVNRDKWEKNK